jgi:hypothetical protein
MSIDDLFLEEVRRRVPDADVVARPAPIDTGRRVDPRVARDEADAVESLAAQTLVERWRAFFPGESEPTDLRLRWVPTQTTDAVGAEAAARQPGFAGAATARLDQVEALLDDEDWSWTRRDPPGGGNIRIIGRQRQVGFDLGIRLDDDVVVLRARTVAVVVGDLAGDLVETPVQVRPWPSGS